MVLTSVWLNSIDLSSKCSIGRLPISFDEFISFVRGMCLIYRWYRYMVFSSVRFNSSDLSS